jgi:hypothetical protein
MPKINMNVWKHRVSHTCLHALREAGYRKPKDIAYVRVSSLLQIPELDANDVTSMLSALYDTIYTTRPPVSNNLSREELADAIHKICEEHDFDINPESLLALTAKELVNLTEGDEVVLPQMVRKIKHIMLGKLLFVRKQIFLQKIILTLGLASRTGAGYREGVQSSLTEPYERLGRGAYYLAVINTKIYHIR